MHKGDASPTHSCDIIDATAGPAACSARIPGTMNTVEEGVTQHMEGKSRLSPQRTGKQGTTRAHNQLPGTEDHPRAPTDVSQAPRATNRKVPATEPSLIPPRRDRQAAGLQVQT